MFVLSKKFKYLRGMNTNKYYVHFKRKRIFTIRYESACNFHITTSIKKNKNNNKFNFVFVYNVGREKYKYIKSLRTSN